MAQAHPAGAHPQRPWQRRGGGVFLGHRWRHRSDRRDRGGDLLADPDHQLADQRGHHPLPGYGVADGTMVEADAKYRYSVAWVDSLDPKGRGVLTCGDHAPAEALPKAQQPDPLHYDPMALASPPPFLPGGLPNKLTVRAFDEAWYRKATKRRVGELQAIAPFFHPLDGVQDWNRIYGPAGFLQHQFAVPNEAAHLVPRMLEALRKVGAPSFLTVLKRFGPSNPAPLSFPIPCWTLAADVPAAVPGLLGVLNQLDEEVAATGGRLYVAKGSSQAEGLIKKTYHRISECIRCEGFLDPEATLTSSLSQRLGIGCNAGSG